MPELTRLYTSTELAYEIASLVADAVVSQAKRLVELPADKEARAALRSERRRIKDSPDWLDRLITERMALDAEQKNTP